MYQDDTAVKIEKVSCAYHVPSAYSTVIYTCEMGVVTHKGQGLISQRFCELMIEILWLYFFFTLISLLMTKWGHDFAHVTTAELPWRAKFWPDWIFFIEVREAWILTISGLWTHKSCVKWVLETSNNWSMSQYWTLPCSQVMLACKIMWPGWTTWESCTTIVQQACIAPMWSCDLYMSHDLIHSLTNQNTALHWGSMAGPKLINNWQPWEYCITHYDDLISTPRKCAAY